MGSREYIGLTRPPTAEEQSNIESDPLYYFTDMGRDSAWGGAAFAGQVASGLGMEFIKAASPEAILSLRGRAAIGIFSAAKAAGSLSLLERAVKEMKAASRDASEKGWQ